MPLPALTAWDVTIHSLHRAAQLLGTLRMLLLSHVPNYLELAIKIRPEGLSTDLLPGGSEVILDFRQGAMVVQPAVGDSFCIPLAEHNAVTLFEALLETLNATGLTILLANSKDNALPQPEKSEDLAPFEFDPQTACDYAAVLYSMFTGAARFRARLTGTMTPIVVWPEHFDLSFLWFAGDQPDESSSHMNFGFAPFSPGFEQPYLYAYVWPLPEGYRPTQLPPQASWHTEGWKGIVVPYHEIAAADDPAYFIEEMCLTIYATLLPVIRG